MKQIEHPKELWPGLHKKGIDYMMSELFQKLQEDIVMELLSDEEENDKTN